MLSLSQCLLHVYYTMKIRIPENKLENMMNKTYDTSYKNSFKK